MQSHPLLLFHTYRDSYCTANSASFVNDDRMATFFCQTVGIDAFWSINDETVLAHGNSDLINRGWRFNETLIPDVLIEHNNICNLTLQIPSNIEFNNTKIYCISSVHDPAISDPVYLIIKGIIHQCC